MFVEKVCEIPKNKVTYSASITSSSIIRISSATPHFLSDCRKGTQRSDQRQRRNFAPRTVLSGKRLTSTNLKVKISHVFKIYTDYVVLDRVENGADQRTSLPIMFICSRFFARISLFFLFILLLSARSASDSVAVLPSAAAAAEAEAEAEAAASPP